MRMFIIPKGSRGFAAAGDTFKPWKTTKVLDFVGEEVVWDRSRASNPAHDQVLVAKNLAAAGFSNIIINKVFNLVGQNSYRVFRNEGALEGKPMTALLFLPDACGDVW